MIHEISPGYNAAAILLPLPDHPPREKTALVQTLFPEAPVKCLNQDLSVGLPGRINQVLLVYLRTFEVNSGPLSTLMILGRGLYMSILCSISLMTDAAGSQLGTTVKYLPFGSTRSGSVTTVNGILTISH